MSRLTHLSILLASALFSVSAALGAAPSMSVAADDDDAVSVEFTPSDDDLVRGEWTTGRWQPINDGKKNGVDIQFKSRRMDGGYEVKYQLHNRYTQTITANLVLLYWSDGRQLDAGHPIRIGPGQKDSSGGYYFFPDNRRWSGALKQVRLAN